jgi:hypothetical protein
LAWAKASSSSGSKSLTSERLFPHYQRTRSQGLYFHTLLTLPVIGTIMAFLLAHDHLYDAIAVIGYPGHLTKPIYFSEVVLMDLPWSDLLNVVHYAEFH